MRHRVLLVLSVLLFLATVHAKILRKTNFYLLFFRDDIEISKFDSQFCLNFPIDAKFSVSQIKNQLIFVLYRTN